MTLWAGRGLATMYQWCARGDFPERPGCLARLDNRQVTKWQAEELRGLLATSGPDPPLTIDGRHRTEVRLVFSSAVRGPRCISR